MSSDLDLCSKCGRRPRHLSSFEEAGKRLVDRSMLRRSEIDPVGASRSGRACSHARFLPLARSRTSTIASYPSTRKRLGLFGIVARTRWACDRPRGTLRSMRDFGKIAPQFWNRRDRPDASWRPIGPGDRALPRELPLGEHDRPLLPAITDALATRSGISRRGALKAPSKALRRGVFAATTSHRKPSSCKAWPDFRSAPSLSRLTIA